MTMDMLKAPEIERHWALFLDLDGTLLDIALAPDEVIIPPGLIDALARVGAALNGALAVVSGRRLADIDRMLSPLRLPVAAEHGAVVRLPSGSVDSVSPVRRPPPEWAAQLREATHSWDGILVEEKTYSIAIHYRLAPHRMNAVKQLATSLVRSDPQFELLAAKQAFEVRPKEVTKGRAVQMLIETEPFRARQPVFVGDDVTDEDGMEVAARLGGFGLNVGAVFGGKPPAVRDWLNRAADALT
jgi:trehalose 6-phosphate phosphatase